MLECDRNLIDAEKEWVKKKNLFNLYGGPTYAFLA